VPIKYARLGVSGGGTATGKEKRREPRPRVARRRRKNTKKASPSWGLRARRLGWTSAGAGPRCSGTRGRDAGGRRARGRPRGRKTIFIHDRATAALRVVPTRRRSASIRFSAASLLARNHAASRTSSAVSRGDIQPSNVPLGTLARAPDEVRPEREQSPSGCAAPEGGSGGSGEPPPSAPAESPGWPA
jgi:hypothetical protein